MRIASYIKEWRSTVKEAIAQASIATNCFCLIHFTNIYICSSIMVHGISMLPKLNLAGDILLVERVSYRLRKVGPGDIVLVRFPYDPARLITKRIIAMAGDSVTFLPHLTDPYSSRTVVIPEGHVWIQGDNMYASTDSRSFGPLPYGLIEGKVFLRVWPLHSFGSLRQ